MSAQQPPPQKKLTALEAIEIFRRLMPKVTDDSQAIEAAYQQQSRRIQKMANSPNPLDQQEAKAWDEAAAILRDPTRRTTLIKVIYEGFRDIADAALLNSVNQPGGGTLTQELVDHLVSIAQNQFKTDDALAQRFVADYLIERNLKICDPIIRPESVINPLAVASPGKIELAWQLPAKGCDSVEITRYTVKKGKASASGKVLTTIAGTGFSDSDEELQPGTLYRYTLTSISSSHKLENPSQVEALAVAEVQDFKAEWSGDHVVLSWIKPEQGDVYLFRSHTPIVIATGTDVPREAPGSQLIHHGRDQHWQDRDVLPGQTYYYRAVVLFEKGIFTPGVSDSIPVPQRPPSVSRAWAQPDGSTVVVGWEAVKYDQVVDYVVLRQEGRRPLTSSRGDALIVTRETAFLDNRVQNGHRYTYTIFTRCADLDSAEGCSTPAVTLAADVDELMVEELDSMVIFRWKSPPEAEKVIVRRSDRSTDIPVIGGNSAQDAGLTNGRTYYYSVKCQYDIDNQKVSSRGLDRPAAPTPEPGKLAIFDVDCRENRVVCTWQHDGPGSVIVLRSHVLPALKPGELFAKSRLVGLGTQVNATGDGRAVDNEADARNSIYTAVVVSGHFARMGPSKQCIIAPPPICLSAERVLQGVELRWEWPRGSNSVHIARRSDAPPEGLNDKQAAYVTYSKTQYESNHNCYLDREVGSERCFYIVRAHPDGAPENFFSAGCQFEVLPGRVGTLHYKLEVIKNGMLRRRVFLALKWRFEVLPDCFHGFVLAGNPGRVPETADDGLILYQWTPENPRQLPWGSQEMKLTRDQDPVSRLGKRFYFKLFPIKSEDLAQLIIVEPYLLGGITVSS